MSRPVPTVNIASHLPAMAALEPDRPAVIFARTGASLSFRELDAEVNRVADGLRAIGITRGTRTVLMVTPGPAFFALTFALFKIGAVPVVVDPGMGIANLKACLAEAEPAAFIGIPKAHVARVLFGWGRGFIRTNLTVGLRLGWGGTTLDAAVKTGAATRDADRPDETRADDTAAILFTSGSTGVPKGVVYTHGIFAAQVEHLRTIYGIEPGEIDLPTFPLFGLFDPALGMTAVIPDMDFTRPGRVDAKDILGPIQTYGATNMFGSPALLDRVSRDAPDGTALPSLRRVISAGAPAQRAILERFGALLSNDAEIFTPYGATESLPVANIGSKAILLETQTQTDRGAGTCVGHPVKGVTAAILPITDAPLDRFDESTALPPGEVGEIAVRSDVVTREYYGRPESTRAAKMRDDGGFVWHRMGDVGYRDDAGRLWFCGRKAHRVETADGTLFSVQVEGVFNTVDGVRRTALVGVGDDPHAQTPVVCVEPEPGTRLTPALIETLRARGAAFPLTAGIRVFLEHRSFPVDVRHNAKIFREKLAVWARQKLERTVGLDVS